MTSEDLFILQKMKIPISNSKSTQEVLIFVRTTNIRVVSITLVKKITKIIHYIRVVVVYLLLLSLYRQKYTFDAQLLNVGLLPYKYFYTYIPINNY